MTQNRSQFEGTASKSAGESHPRSNAFRKFRKAILNPTVILVCLLFFCIIFEYPFVISSINSNSGSLTWQSFLDSLPSILWVEIPLLFITSFVILLRYLMRKDLILESAILSHAMTFNGLKPRSITLRPPSTLRSLAWSPDKHILASASGIRTTLPPPLDTRSTSIQLWNVENGELIRTLKIPSGILHSLAWSPDGHTLASASRIRTTLPLPLDTRSTSIQLWNVENGELIRTLKIPSGILHSLAWSPDGHTLASASSDKSIQLWNAENGELIRTLIGHSASVNSVAWSPDGHTLASASSDRSIRLWNAENGELIRTLIGHSASVNSVAWSPDGHTLASASSDKSIRLWDPMTGRLFSLLEGHTGTIRNVSFSSDGFLLASQSSFGDLRLWRSDTGETLIILNEHLLYDSVGHLAFHSKKPVLATILDTANQVITIWDLDVPTILDTTPIVSSIRYTNAKVVLVGDSGVGKSSLGFALTNHGFVPTESTHGRRIWIFDNKEVERNAGHKETREILLWDLAGQPGYRLIHQLHLNEVAIALIVFDSRNETDPFAGVQYWNRALQLAHSMEGNSATPMKKFLIAARIDRGGRGVSLSRINELLLERGFDGYFETSSKEGQGIEELKQTLQKSIDWEALPKVSSTEIFQRIKNFLIIEKASGRKLSIIDDLYRVFLKTEKAFANTNVLRAQFETCIKLVESRGLIRKLNFGNLILLQPELLDAYASALVNAVKDEPDGLGSIIEEKVREGNFSIPEDERIKDKEQEKLLLLAMIEDMLRYEIALREESLLVFPSQSTRKKGDLPDPKGKTMIFSFAGPVYNVYATLAVRLWHSGLFKKQELWENAVTYTAHVGGTCGIFLRHLEEGNGELTIFFNDETSQETRSRFEEFIKTHLERRALPQSIQQQRIVRCPKCGLLFTDSQVKYRQEHGYDWIMCVCNKRVPLHDPKERSTVVPSLVVQEMDDTADTQREREVEKSILQGKIKTRDFDVFLCYNRDDKPEVKKIEEQLKGRGILPWLDERELRPGLPWQRLLSKQIKQIKSAAVFVGRKGIGPWQQHELEAFLRQFMKRGCPVIPVLLESASKKPQLPIFLDSMTWVDFRIHDPDPMEQLMWGITGRHDWLEQPDE